MMIKRMVLKRFFVLVLLFITPVLGLYALFFNSTKMEWFWGMEAV